MAAACRPRQRAAIVAPMNAEAPRPPLTCWAVTEGYKGMESQALGLAEAMGLTPVLKRTAPRLPWSRLPPRLWPMPLRSPGRDADPLAPPWPDLVISCGKRAVPVARAIKHANGGRTFTVHIQTPPVPDNWVDLLVVPEHDGKHGPNVITTRAAVHRVTEARLAEAATRFEARLAALPRPRVAVLIGGSNSRHRLTPAITRDLGARLAALSRTHGAGLMVTPSRRTGAENEAILRDALADLPAEIWDGSGDNPYFAYLAVADAIVVTNDSVSMASEAVTTGKPVYVVELAGHSRRIDAFHQNLRNAGITRLFDGTLERWSYAPIDDTARAAEEIWHRMGLWAASA